MTQQATDARPFEQHRFLGRLNLHAGTPPSQFILYNHVTDYYHYGPGGRFLPMRETLIRYLRALDYEIIAIYNTSEGLLFAEPDMEQRYLAVTTGQELEIDDYFLDDEPIQAPRDVPEPSAPPPTQSAEQIIAGLGTLLRQTERKERVRAAVIVERVQNMVSSQPVAKDRQILDQLQSWSSISNGNVSLLVADVARMEELPAALMGQHRSGVALIDVGLPKQEEINLLLIYAQMGWLPSQFGKTTQYDGARTVEINREQRRDIMTRLEGHDTVTIRAYFNECIRRGIGELDLRTLRLIMSHSEDVWPEALSNMGEIESKLKERVLGQEYALQAMIDTLRSVQDDLHNQAQTGQVKEGLLAYFFFAGPTGVGKTEVFRMLGEVLNEKKIATRKFNMPEYNEEHSSARFFGAPPGYVGYGRGELGRFLIENPAAIVLFDEFEKAHPKVRKNFLTMLEGSLTTGDGVRVDLSQALFIFTSNAGAADLQPILPAMSRGEQENIRNHNRKLIRQDLSRQGTPPELIGRLLDVIIPFNHMTEAVIQRIINKELRQLTERYHVQFHPSINAFLLDLYAQDKSYGARRIVMHIQITLKGEVLRLLKEKKKIRAQNAVIYKDNSGVTRLTSNPDVITTPYQRRLSDPTNPQHSTRQPTRISNPADQRAFREAVSPGIAAILTFDSQGRYRGSGTGFFITDRGHLLTCSHVVEGCTRIEAVHNKGEERSEMVLIGYNSFHDLAVLKPVKAIEGDFAFFDLGNSGSVEVDSKVVTFGYPYLDYDPISKQISFTEPERKDGHIDEPLEQERLFRLAVGLNPGNSGGPLFRADEKGQVIGVIMAERHRSEGMSFAIMSSVVQTFLREMGIVQPVVRVDR